MSCPAARPSDARRARRPAAMFPALVAAVVLGSCLGGCENPEVRDITPALQDDSPLSRQVAEALDERPEIAMFSISVKALEGGTIRLSGAVDNDGQRHVAGQTAAAVPGVRSVINTLYLRR